MIRILRFLLPDQMRIGDIPFASTSHCQNELLSSILAHGVEINAGEIVGVHKRSVQFGTFQKSILIRIAATKGSVEKRFGNLLLAHKGLDLPGNFDSDRLFAAGASIVYASSPEFSLIYRRNQEEWSIEQICTQIAGDVDLVITEGFKGKDFPKIEVLRQEISTSTLEITNVLARVADFPLEDSVPTFSFEQQEEITAFILEYLGMN